MPSTDPITYWKAGRVNRAEEHFRLRYCSGKDEQRTWLPVALVGPPLSGIVTVQFVADVDDPRSANAVSAATYEIQYHLIDKGEPDPWLYAKKFCAEDAHPLSDVHWSFRKARRCVIEPKAAMNPAAQRSLPFP